MSKIELNKNEDIEKALKKFKRKLLRDGVMDEMRKREFYEKPSAKRRKQEAKAKIKEYRRRQRQDEW